MTESGGHTRSEAVYLDAVSGDGEVAMVARLCRYPQRGVQWAWLHVFVGARAYSFTDHGLAPALVHADAIGQFQLAHGFAQETRLLAV